jgi:hypothetical protein
VPVPQKILPGFEDRSWDILDLPTTTKYGGVAAAPVLGGRGVRGSVATLSGAGASPTHTFLSTPQVAGVYSPGADGGEGDLLWNVSFYHMHMTVHASWTGQSGCVEGAFSAT